MILASKQAPPTQSVADWSDAAELQQQFYLAADELVKMSHDVALAKHVIEYDNDRRKRALARAMSAPLIGGTSAAAAEAEGRASEPYGQELAQLGKEYETAQAALLAYDAVKIRWETSRSLLAMLREATRQL